MPQSPLDLRCLALALAVNLPASVWTSAEDWMPLDPAHLALSAPVVEKDADAEAIFWQVRVDDEVTGGDARARHQHALRVKIFTEKGKEAQGQVNLVHPSWVRIGDVAGRTIRPDGSILELKKDDVYEKTIVKKGGRRLEAVSFALPGVEPGAIVEYRWTETYVDALSNYAVLPLQRDIPIWRVKYLVRPLELPGFPYPMRSQTFNVPAAPWTKEAHGFYGITFEKIPALREEPHMPPEDEVRAWMLVYYTAEGEPSSEKFWSAFGRETYKAFKDQLKPNAVLAAAAQKAVEGAATPADKLARLVDFCRTKVKNVTDDASTLAAGDWDRASKSRTPKDTLENGVGDARQIGVLFGALAAASGFETRIALASDRSRIFFDASFCDPYFLRTPLVAVRDGETWHLYEPGSRYVTPGMLRWQNEGVQVLVSDANAPFFMRAPISPAEKSMSHRTAKLRLTEDGTLEGEIALEYSGHAASTQKERYDGMSAEQRTESVRETVREHLPDAEVSEIRLENVTEPERPIVIGFRVRVPGYAQRSGRRMFVQPAFFQKGEEPRFSAQQRHHRVVFDFPWSEKDEVTIDLPAGFVLDHPDSPPGIAAAPVAEYAVTLSYARPSRTLAYNRRLSFGGTGVILFDPDHYAALKQVFDNVHLGDSHTITLRQIGAAPGGTR